MSIWDSSENYQINNFESIKNDLTSFFEFGTVSVDEVVINDSIFYTIKQGGCSCDFFTYSDINELRENLECFISFRMRIQSIEPYILVKWVEGDSKIDSVPNEKIDVYDLFQIFKSRDPNGLYCIKRIKQDQDEKYNKFVISQKNNLMRRILYILKTMINEKK